MVGEIPVTVEAALASIKGIAESPRRRARLHRMARVPDLKMCERRKALLAAGGNLLVLGLRQCVHQS